MTFDQQTRVLDWIEALISGQYKQGRGALFNPETGCYDPIGVACEINKIPRDGLLYCFTPEIAGTAFTFYSNKTVPTAWFAERFGLRRPVAMFTALNDHSNNYLSVVAILFNDVPISMRRHALHTKFMEQVDATVRQR